MSSVLGLFFFPAESKFLHIAFFAEKLERLELITYDSRLNTRGAFQPSDKIVVVTIDENSIEALGRWPWSRKIHAEMIRTLKNAGARVIAFDVGFPDRSIKKDDEELAGAAKSAGNVVVVYYGSYDNAGNFVPEPPYPELQQSVAGAGVALIPIDMDRTVRRIELFKKFGEKKVEAFSLAVLSIYEPLIRLPFDLERQDSIPVNFCGRDFVRLPYEEVLKGKFPEGAFRDKIALIYSIADPLDRKITPLKKNGKSREIPGGEVHANAINTMLTGKYIHRLSDRKNWIIGFILCMISTFSLMRLTQWRGIFLNCVIWVVYILAVYFVFIKTNLWIDLVVPLTMAVTSTVVISLYESMRIKHIFSWFVPRQLLEKMLVSSKSLELGGKNVEATVLFTDVRGYTTIAEKESPEKVMQFLNKLHGLIGNVIIKYRGTVCDYQGDAQMVVFGAPEPLKEHAYMAVRAALEMQQQVEKLSGEVQASGGQPLDIGVGICSGTVAFGLIGEATHKQYAAIGDVTNTAARLQALSRQLSSPVIISESTKKLVEDRISVEPLDPVILKGRTEPTQIYRIIGAKAGK
ncbi:MAG: adenylate/guanylate cyclase domain-containing protein [Firmicutes bacterium]|nr:adenylate/guanylate cyclase domain-containing protein [Bacillota bacterium]